MLNPKKLKQYAEPVCTPKINEDANERIEKGRIGNIEKYSAYRPMGSELTANFYLSQ